MGCHIKSVDFPANFLDSIDYSFSSNLLTEDNDTKHVFGLCSDK